MLNLSNLFCKSPFVWPYPRKSTWVKYEHYINHLIVCKIFMWLASEQNCEGYNSSCQYGYFRCYTKVGKQKVEGNKWMCKLNTDKVLWKVFRVEIIFFCKLKNCVQYMIKNWQYYFGNVVHIFSSVTTNIFVGLLTYLHLFDTDIMW